MELGEEDFDENQHERLVNAISKLDKTQHIKQPLRNEPTNLNSEFNLVKSSNNLDLNNVVKVLENTAHNVQVSKKLKKTNDANKVLPKPFEKPERERAKRSTGYEVTKKKVGRWDPVVARTRTVDYVSFPLKHATYKLQPTSEFLSKFKSKSPLELELEEVDPQPVEEEKQEEEQIYPMSYEEMIVHRQQTAKLRAQQSFMAAKAKRQSKIKSKKFHRIMKKEKLKQQIKEFEELQKTDPEEAIKKLDALEKARALERHTLRHKNTGKWAKNLLVRAKYDKEVRQQLAEQLAVSRSLTKKTSKESSDEEEFYETTSKDIADPSDKPDSVSKMAALINQTLEQNKNNLNDTVNIDPTRFIEAKPKFLNTAIPGASELDCLDDDEEMIPRVNIEEVFEEDDVVASFRQEKEDEANKDQPKDIDLSLPGWGSWGGKGVKAPRKRRNRFILKAPPKFPRKDENKGDIIIKEYKDPKLSSHKVSEVPFPFTSVKEYEASIRAPLGNTFIPEKAHKKLIKPSVITKSGAIIEPMDEEELLVPRNRCYKNENVIKVLGDK